MVPNCATAEDLLKAIKDEKVQMIDLRFTDLPGVWQHFSVPPSAVNARFSGPIIPGCSIACSRASAASKPPPMTRPRRRATRSATV